VIATEAESTMVCLFVVGVGLVIARQPKKSGRQACTEFLRTYLPDSQGSCTTTCSLVCMYLLMVLCEDLSGNLRTYILFLPHL